MSGVRIETDRFALRPLTPDDATPRYLDWLAQDEVREHIVTASETRSLDSLRGYIASRSGRDDVLFLGIFDLQNGTHVGNVKYEPLNVKERFAIMGILIGEPAWRGRGVAEEVIRASAQWLNVQHGIRDIILSVMSDHQAAISSYRKIGFKIEHEPRISLLTGAISMVWHVV